MPMTTRLYVIKTKEQNRKNKKKIGEGDRKRVTCDCTRSLLLAVFIAVVLVCIGISMCFIAYHASSSIMGLGSKDMHPGEADKQLSEGDSRIYKLLYNLRIVGPILMGTGGFIILCSIVVAYRDEKEKKEVASELLSRIDPRGSGNVDVNGAPYDIYDLAIRKYLQISDEKTRRRNTPQGTITLPNEKKDMSNKNSAKTSPRTDTDRSTGQLESRKNSMKSLENALIKIGGLVPQGMFIRRGSEVAPSQLQESEDMGRTGSVLIPRSTQQTSQQSTVEVNNYPLRTTVSCTVAIPNMSRNTNNPVQSESSSEDSNKSTPKKNKRPNSSVLDTPRTQEQTPNQTTTNKKQSKSEVQKSGNEKSSKSNNQPSRAASGRIPGNRKSVPLLVVNDHIKQTSQNQKKIEELKREDSNGSTGSDTAVIPNGAMCPPSPSPSINHTGGLNQLPNKAMKLTEVSD